MARNSMNSTSAPVGPTSTALNQTLPSSFNSTSTALNATEAPITLTTISSPPSASLGNLLNVTSTAAPVNEPPTLAASTTTTTTI